MWTVETIMSVTRERLVDLIVELLKRMGFREYEKVARRGEWGLDIVALRSDPIAGTEKIVIAVHEKGLASSRDVNVFADIINSQKADKGILVSPAGFTKDAKLLLSREYRGRIVPWDGEKLASLLNNYSIPVPDDLKVAEREEKEEKAVLNEYHLDAPLLYDFSPDKVLERVAKIVSSRFPVKADEVELASLRVDLDTAYIVSWSVEEGKRGEALVLSGDEMILNAESDPKLANQLRKVKLDSPAVIQATERTINTPLSPGEAVVLLKERAAREFGVTENQVRIIDRRKVYIPRRAEVEFRVGSNRGKALVELPDGKVEVELRALPEKYFIERTVKAVSKETGEEVRAVEVIQKERKITVRGKTERFSFEASFNPYTGKLLHLDTRMSDDAVRKLIESSYPGSEILGIELNKKSAVADVLVNGTVLAVRIDLRNGKMEELAKFPPLDGAIKKAKEVIESNFPVKGLELSSFRVTGHKYLELELEGEDGRARVKIDGSTGDMLDYYLEITEKRAGELVAERYPGYSVVSVIAEKDEYLVDAEGETHEIRVRLSKDGKVIEEVDRVLRRKLAEKMAEERVREIDPEAKVEGIELAENWVVRFTGVSKVGELVLHRATGGVIEKRVNFTERAIEEMYRKHVKEKYGEGELRTERLTHYKDRGYVHIKLSGSRGLYYARIDSRTGKILKEDTAPLKGFTAKLKQMQLEREYR
ncbi:restriction endonuclease [Thermococcus sp. AM4]|uniref:restriction endonuclease n=1 Tax=Thermococcus sp. (strain AM4) TaxID=246969 RepID=UPI00018707FC|nr:restriction endonuclease [Thermococcus sp. AM4]EEB73061.1 type II restriction endonuclease [Thermococcus sp. AM4]